MGGKGRDEGRNEKGAEDKGGERREGKALDERSAELFLGPGGVECKIYRVAQKKSATIENHH